MTTLFISDLHLDASRPDITGQFLRFLGTDARSATALYILGDLFEVWIGDDDLDNGKREIVAALKGTVDAGVPTFFMHGNRDFLIGPGFAAASGCELLPDPTIVELHGERVLLMHGDTLCTDDEGYQRFRSMVRDPAWQTQFLAMSIPERLALADQAREGSRAHMAQTADEIMDVNQGAVEQAMRSHDVATLLHGHTHRPDVHCFSSDGRERTRIVLGDWYEQGSMVRWNESGFELLTLPR